MTIIEGLWLILDMAMVDKAVLAKSNDKTESCKKQSVAQWLWLLGRNGKVYWRYLPVHKFQLNLLNDDTYRWNLRCHPTDK